MVVLLLFLLPFSSFFLYSLVHKRLSIGDVFSFAKNERSCEEGKEFLSFFWGCAVPSDLSSLRLVPGLFLHRMVPVQPFFASRVPFFLHEFAC